MFKMGMLKNALAKLKPYIIDLTCENCGFPNKTKVPRGMKVTEFIKQGKCKCDNCGIIFYPKEYKTKWLT